MAADPAQSGPARPRRSGVQSVERAFELLEIMADAGGIMGLSQLAAHSALPVPTIHRLIRTLLDLGYVRQEPSREYALGPRLMKLGDGATALIGVWALPHLRTLVTELGESANLAMLDGDQVVYVAQAPGRHSMRMFTEVGRRTWPHATAVGKAMLAQLSDEQVAAISRRGDLPALTQYTITDPTALVTELAEVRRRGYAMDEQEQELGVRCVAVALPTRPAREAVSISGPLTRMTDELVARAVPLLTIAAANLAHELNLNRRSSREPVIGSVTAIRMSH
jgi:IclR family acetate operon transcriptional repressor